MRKGLANQCVWLVLAVSSSAQVAGQSPAGNIFTAKTVYLEVRSHGDRSAVSEKDPAIVRRKAVDALRSFKGYTLVPDAADADVIMEVAYARDYVYGEYRSQSAPTAFLHVRNRSSDAPLYCGTEHSGFFTSATKKVFAVLRRRIDVHDPSLDRPPIRCL